MIENGSKLSQAFFVFFFQGGNKFEYFMLSLKQRSLLTSTNCPKIYQFAYLRDNFAVQLSLPNNTSFITIQIGMQSQPIPPQEKKEPIPRTAYIKLQLPPVFSSRQQPQLLVYGYRFDPTRRLTSTKQVQTIRKDNVGEIIVRIKDEIKSSLGLIQEKHWKGIQREIPSFTFELEIAVRVLKNTLPAVQVRPLIAGSTQIHTLLEVNLDKDDSASLQTSITQKTEQLMNLLSNSIQPSKGVITLAPQKLFNPHAFIRTLPKQKHIQYYVKGVYEYYHYGDQSFNDHGWGCAYRSLQSLLSWLSLQGHLRLPRMLTIPQIQSLIDRINLGSKDKLYNTKEWIGATEVAWVVKNLTNYDCRILHVSDGKKIMEECEVIREHLEKVGSPIMYGGGEYAYSIVGINYSWKLGECEFLILDPHYAGGDSMDKVIEKKGLCWRKPDEMFKKGVFYNFCMPIIP